MPASIRRTVAVVAAVTSIAGVAVFAEGVGIDRGATVSRGADRIVKPVGDVAVAYDTADVDQFVIDGVNAAVAAVGGLAATSRSGSVGLIRVSRAGATVHAPPSDYLIPMVFVSLPREAIGGVFGFDVSAVLGGDAVVLNRITADLMGAALGDVLDLRTVGGSTLSVRVGDIRSDDEIGSTELVFTTPLADRLGFTADTRVVMWGFDDRQALDVELARAGVLGRRDTKVSRSWDPFDPDWTLSTADVKVLLGEPWYRVNSDDSLSMHPTWTATNLTDGSVLLNDVIRIRARCHVEIVDDLMAALADVAAAGLGGAIEVANANTYGGCFNPRYSRNSGFLSRHSYAMALDTNTVSNCAGCRPPPMDCRVVRIFRRHGFAWGGNFRQPDGMHFEWVGEPRDQIDFPSTYCPNLVPPLTESLQTSSIGLRVLVAGDPIGAQEHSHAP